jgi:energy-coupling factor transporter ATP-binding protein EcfA2
MSAEANRSVRAGLPPGARLLHLYQPGDVMPNGRISTGKEPKAAHGHRSAVSQDMFLDWGEDTNIGIALDGQFLLADFDVGGPLAEAELRRLGPTWRQKTLRGVHALFTVPPGWEGRNCKYVVADENGRQTVIGDIKAKGYIVGPGSLREGGFRYHVIDDRAPAPAPDWLLERATDHGDIEMALALEERDKIPIGENDNELAKIAGFLRGPRRFSEGAIAAMLTGIIGSGVLEQDPARGLYSARDAARIAKSAAKWELGSPDAPAVRLRPEGWKVAADSDLVVEAKEWWLERFFPKGEMVLLYGEGGIGKSRLLSWMAARVTRAGGLFGHVGVEEPFQIFALTAAVLGADLSRLYHIPVGSSLQLPRDATALSAALVESGCGFLYLDSIYTHFEHEKGQNAAERARTALGALADIATRTGCTIVGTFHENKGGAYLGSTEMRNVARVFLRATRKPGGPLRLTVEKTNWPEPGYALDFTGEPRVLVDPRDGSVQMERLEDGSLVPLELVLPSDPERVSLSSAQAGDIEEPVDRGEAAASRAEQAREMRADGASIKEIEAALGVTRNTVMRYLRAEK